MLFGWQKINSTLNIRGVEVEMIRSVWKEKCRACNFFEISSVQTQINAGNSNLDRNHFKCQEQQKISRFDEKPAKTGKLDYVIGASQEAAVSQELVSPNLEIRSNEGAPFLSICQQPVWKRRYANRSFSPIAFVHWWDSTYPALESNAVQQARFRCVTSRWTYLPLPHWASRTLTFSAQQLHSSGMEGKQNL